MNTKKAIQLINRLASIADEELKPGNEPFEPPSDWIWVWCDIVKKAQQIRGKKSTCELWRCE